jgi:hypothetical protein
MCFRGLIYSTFKVISSSSSSSCCCCYAEFVAFITYSILILVCYFRFLIFLGILPHQTPTVTFFWETETNET